MSRFEGPIPPERIEALLATRRVAPSNKDWLSRVIALQQVERHAAPALEARLRAEVRAMFRERDEAADRRVQKTAAIAKEDWAALVWCPLRAPSVIGVNTDKLPREGRPCWLCGTSIAGRRLRWCSDACVIRWSSNHEWSQASFAALRRDGRKCVRCESKRSPEVNHIDPRVGRGYHQGCHHHLDGLETLCHACHVDETNRQRRERIGANRG